MSSRSKIFFHPDKEEIVRMMLNGVSVQRIEQWLIDKYPDHKENWVSLPTLQLFRKEHLKLDKEALGKLKKAQLNKESEQKTNDIVNSIFAPTDEVRNIIKPIAQSAATYREKVSEVADLHLDVPRKIMELDKLITSRIEYYFNKVSENESTDANIKADRVLAEYLKQQSELAKDWKRFVDGLAEQNAEASIQLEMVQEHIGIMRDTIRDLLNEVNPDLAMRFLENLTDRLNAIQYRHQTFDIAAQSKKLDKQIIEVKTEIKDEGEGDE